MKPETQDQLEKAARTLEAARRDLAEADPDNAIARAYYAAFHAATAALIEAGQVARTHKGIHHLFRQTFVESGEIERHHSRAFNRLYQNRQEADYLVGKVFTPEAAADAVRLAESLVDAIEGLLRSRP